MRQLRDALVDIAVEAPAVDLTDWAIAGSRRRRRTRLAISAAAVAVTVVAGLTVFVGSGLLPAQDKPVVASETGKIPELPGRGVGPLSHAFRTFCHVGGPIPPDCRNGGWRVVTKSGQTYHVPQALGGKSGPAFYPLAISRDGRVIAYYSRQARTFQVRDLAGGAVRTAPVTVAESRLGRNARLVLSDDGRYLAFTGWPSSKEDGLIFDLGAGRTYRLPAGWEPRSVDGTTVTLARDWRKWQKSGIWLMPPAGGGTPATVDGRFMSFSPPAPNGARVAALRLDKAARRPDGTITVLDAGTGKIRKTVLLGGLPKDTRPLTLGAWLNASEVTLSALPSEHWAENRQITYAVDVETGQARQLAVYRPQSLMHVVIPGATVM